MPPELTELLKPLGPNGAWALVVLLILRWIGDRVDKWADAAIKQAVTNEAMRALIESITDVLQRIEGTLQRIESQTRDNARRP